MTKYLLFFLSYLISLSSVAYGDGGVCYKQAQVLLHECYATCEDEDMDCVNICYEKFSDKLNECNRKE